MEQRLTWLLTIVVACGAGGCSRNRGSLIRSEGTPAQRIVGLYACDDETGNAPVTLDPTRPLTIVVHGCTSSGERFKTLSGVFQAHGQQTLCFNYNDRDFLNTSATQLAAALSQVQSRLEPGELTVLGHSQGGLIARRALQLDLPQGLVVKEGFTFRLVTVSAPFAGIASSADCSRVWLHALSLSATVMVCLAVTGNKWTEIPPGSGFMTNTFPTLATRHLHIVTDERGSCRSFAPDGRCTEDDFVFSLREQNVPLINEGPHVTTIKVQQGHSAVVGENGVVPRQLLEVLQAEGVLAQTPEVRRDAITAMLERLYAR